MTPLPTQTKIKRLGNMASMSPFTLCLLVLEKLGFKNATRAVDARYKDRNKILSTDVDAISLESLSLLLEAFATGDSQKAALITIDEFLSHPEVLPYVSNSRSERLEKLFNYYKSDKACDHNYHRVYQPIIDSLLDGFCSLSIAEIGLGTNNLDVCSNMGIYGHPGASCRAFRDFDERVMMFGGDVDSRILFTEDRISTFYVDQLNLASLDTFIRNCRPGLIIDDGLHAPRANINTLSCAFKHMINDPVLPRTWIVVEDLAARQKELDFWSLILNLFPKNTNRWLIKTKSSGMAVLCLNHESKRL